MVDKPHTGLLHRMLNVAPDKEIPQEQLREGTRSSNEDTRRLSTLAHNLHLKAAKAASDTSGGTK